MLDDDFSKAQAAVLDRYEVAAEERWVDAPVVDGHAHVLVAGDGPPVVLLNRVGVPAAILAPLMARLDGVTHYAVDLPAFGLTDTTPPSPMTCAPTPSTSSPRCSTVWLSTGRW